MDDLDAEERERQLRMLHTQQSFVRVENSMLSEHLSRVVVKRKDSLQLHLEELEREQEEKEAADEANLKASKALALLPESARSGSTAGSVRFNAPTPRPDPVVPMSVEEKCEIVDEECKFQEQNIDKLRIENDHVLDDLRAVFNEANYCTGEIRKDRVDFNRDVLLLAQLNPANKPYSEDILRFVMEKNRRKRIVRDAEVVRNSRTRTEINAMQQLFVNKKDLTELLHAVDFDQLKILNGQLNARMKDRVSEIRRVKKVIKSTMQALAETQKSLGQAHVRGIKVKRSLSDRSPVIQSAKDCITAEKAQRMRLHEAVLIAIQDQDGPPQPSAMDYMKARNQQFNLRKDIKTWLGKVEIAELTFQELEKSLSLLHKFHGGAIYV